MPESRAVAEQAEYVDEMVRLWTALQRFTTDDNRDDVIAAWERYRESYLGQVRSILASRSNIVSTMIAGSSGFPAARMNKRSEALDRKIAAFLAWRERAHKAIYKQFAPPENQPISSTDPNALELLQAKLAKLEAAQERMKQANKLVKKNDRAGLVALGFTEEQADKLLDGTKFGGPGFAPFELSNNRAEIKRVQTRIADVQRAQQVAETFAPVAFVETDDHPSGTLTIEDGRVHLSFEERTSKEFYAKLRGAAFLWSPSREAFVRKATPAALAVAKQLVNA